MHPTIGNELAQAAMADLCQQAHLLWVIVNGFSLEETRTGDPERPGPDLSSEVTRYFASLPGDRFPARRTGWSRTRCAGPRTDDPAWYTGWSRR